MLDVACGTGEWLDACAGESCSVSGVGLSAKEVVRTLEEWDALFVAGGLSVTERWKDLHVLNIDWIKKGKIHTWPFRALQALLLMIWPLRWQYQVYHRCVIGRIDK